MRLALRLLALAAFVAGAAANKNHTAKGLGLGKRFTYRANVAPYAPQGVAAGLVEPSIALDKTGRTLVFGDGEATVNSGTLTGFATIVQYDAKRKTLVEKQRLTGPAAGGRFGEHVALDPTGKVLAISEQGATVNGVLQAGQVHIFTKVGASKQWVLSGTVTPGTFAQANLQFGSFVAISKGGKVLVVGASGGSAPGEVHIFKLASAQKATGFQGKKLTYTLVTRLLSPVANDPEYGSVVSVSADGKYVAVSSPNKFIAGGAAGRVWVYAFNKATNAYAQTAAFTGPTGSNFGIWQQVAPNGKSVAICDAFANSQKGAISIATYSTQQKTFVLTQNNYLPTVPGKTFSFFCSGLAYSPDSKYIAVSESVGTVGALWLMQPSGHKPSNWNITAGPITGPTTGGSFLGRKGLALSQGAKVMAANSLNPKSAWVFDRVKA